MSLFLLLLWRRVVPFLVMSCVFCLNQTHALAFSLFLSLQYDQQHVCFAAGASKTAITSFGAHTATTRHGHTQQSTVTTNTTRTKTTETTATKMARTIATLTENGNDRYEDHGNQNNTQTYNNQPLLYTENHLYCLWQINQLPNQAAAAYIPATGMFVAHPSDFVTWLRPCCR